MKLSHSKLSCLLNCPMTYYLSYVMGISPIAENPALAIGSAVHWGIEHNTEDLTDYFSAKFKSRDNFTRDQLLSEAMIHGYLKHKDEIFDKLLRDENGEKLELVDEVHELRIEAPLKSNVGYEHTFVGIIDLLLLTNKGFIIIDYKTSSMIPDYNQYLDQIYRYIFLCNAEFPGVPIVKIGIINIQKTKIRQKQNENNSQFLNRMRFEYELNDEKYVNYHEFEYSDLTQEFMQDYFDNLSRMADFAHTIDANRTFFINYNAAMGQYGKSDFYDIFYHTPDAYLLYKISDVWLNEDGDLTDNRPCRPIDMLAITNKKLLNKYDVFKTLHSSWKESETDKTFVEFVKEKGFEIDNELLETYFEILNKINK